MEYVLDLTGSIIQYMIHMSEEEGKKVNTKLNIKKEKPDSDSEGDVRSTTCDCYGC